jgi:hypothetical protein
VGFDHYDRVLEVTLDTMILTYDLALRAKTASTEKGNVEQFSYKYLPEESWTFPGLGIEEPGIRANWLASLVFTPKVPSADSASFG